MNDRFNFGVFCVPEVKLWAFEVAVGVDFACLDVGEVDVGVDVDEEDEEDGGWKGLE